MRDAVASTDRAIKEHTSMEAAERGCLGTLKHQHSRGRLEEIYFLCLAAARYGQHEILQWQREKGCPWDVALCMQSADIYGHEDIAE